MSEEGALDLLSDSDGATLHTQVNDFSIYEPGRSAIFVDGHEEPIGNLKDRDVWRSLLRFNDNGPAENWRQTSADQLVSEHPRWGKWIALVSFLVLTLLPLPWVWWCRYSWPGDSVAAGCETL